MNYRLNACKALVCIGLLSTSLLHSFVVPGNAGPAQATTTFTFSIQPQIGWDPSTSRAFVATREALSGDAQPWGLSVFNPKDLVFNPYLATRATVNGSSTDPNPLFGQSIEHLIASPVVFARINGPVVTVSIPLLSTTATPNVAQAIITDSAPGGTSVISTTPPLNDDTNTPSGGIARLVSIAGPDVQTGTPGGAYALLRNAANDPFGAQGSCVRLLAFIRTQQEFPSPVRPGEIVLSTRDSFGEVGMYPPYSVNSSSTFLSSGSPLSAIINGNEVRGTTDFLYGHTYFGLQATSGPAGTVRSVWFDLGSNITPALALDSDSIIGSSDPNTTTSIYHLTTLPTTTGLNYLVVHGGVEGTVPNTTQTVFALPLVNDPTSPAHGSLARISQQPTIIRPGASPIVLGQALTAPATMPGDLYTSASVEAQVGQGPLGAPIYDLFSTNDVVWALVRQGAGMISPGLYASQALFDEYGRIRGWTPWAAQVPQGPVAASVFEAFHGRYISIVGSQLNDLDTVTYTIFNETPATRVLSAFFEDGAGAQGVNDIPFEHPSLDQTLGQSFSFVTITGYQKVALQRTASTSGGTRQNAYDGTSFSGGMGSLAGFVSAPTVSSLLLTGGVLYDAGALITSTIAWSPNDSWLCVGGSNGVYILARPDGTGWQTGTLADGFSGLDDTFAFIRLGNESSVRALVAQEDALFVLSETHLTRYTLTPALVSSGEDAQPVVLATVRDLTVGQQYGQLTDLLVSNQLALIATTKGLWRSGNGVDIRTAPSEMDAQWTVVPLPEGIGSPIRLYPRSATTLPDSWIEGQGGMIYVLDTSISRTQARIYRLTITGLDPVDAVTDSTVQLVPNYFIANVPTFFYSRGHTVTDIATDGATTFMIQPETEPTRFGEIVEVLSPDVRFARLPDKTPPSPIVGIADNVTYRAPEKLSGTGSWLLHSNNTLSLFE